MRPVAAADAQRDEPPVLCPVREQRHVGRGIEAPGVGEIRSGQSFGAKLGNDAAGGEICGRLSVLDIEAQQLAAQVRGIHAIGQAVAGHVNDPDLRHDRTGHAGQLQIRTGIGTGSPQFGAAHQVKHVDAVADSVGCRRRKGGRVVDRVVTATQDHDGIVGIGAGRIDVDTCDHRR